MSEYSLKEIQGRLLDMAKTIVSIFDKHSIPYMITYGTLLGAVRHKGYIPWDDDFDFFILGENLEQIKKVLREELPKDMFFENEESEPLYFHAWPHVKDTNTFAKCDQFPQDNAYTHKGLSIDLYVAYKMRDCDIDLYRIEENIKYQDRKYKIGWLSEEEHTSICENLKKNYIEEKKHPAITDTKEAYGFPLVERVMYLDEIFPLKKYKFEDTEFYGPSDYDTILTRFYGDYMQLPPEDKRIPHYSVVRSITP